VKVITGARRAGKSVLARLGLGDREYACVASDDERLSALTAADLQHLKSACASPWPAARIVFLDEVGTPSSRGRSPMVRSTS
jgi:predicted AAA+ superfamily ATPase